MPQVLPSQQNALSAVDYFKAKLQFESTPYELVELLGKPSVMIVDVRDPESYAKEHIRGAINIPLADIPKSLSQLPKDKTIITYCWTVTCHLATKAALELAHRDYKVQELFGGIEYWKEYAFPVEGSETAVPDAEAEQLWENEGGRPPKT